MNQVVGRASGGQQRDHGVDDGTLVHDAADGRIAFAQCDAQHGACGFACQLVAQVIAGVHKGGAGHVQAHGFEQHLVAVGCAVKSTGAGAVIRLKFRFQQLVSAHQPLRGFFTHSGFVFVGQTRGHGAGRYKDHGQMTEVQRTDQEAWHDLVAHAQHQRAVVHVVRQGHGSGHGDHVAAEQTELHARCSLRDTVTHGRHAAGHLRRGAQFARLSFDQLGVAQQRHVRRQHVVVGIDDADVRGFFGDYFEAVIEWRACQCVRQIGAAHAVRVGIARGGVGQSCQVGAAPRLAALNDALSDVVDCGVKHQKILNL